METFKTIILSTGRRLYLSQGELQKISDDLVVFELIRPTHVWNIQNETV